MKRIITFVLLFTIMLSILPAAFAHDDQAKHDSDLKYALFGSRDKILNGNEKTAFQAIANAAAIMIDQFTPNSTDQWKKSVFYDLQNELTLLGLPKLTMSFDSLDLSINTIDGNKNITASTHRKYTHLGWTYKQYPNMEFWKVRKQVLLQTVNWVLFNSQPSFSWVPWLSDLLYYPSEQCDAFCAIIYYIHILGDHIEGDVPDKLTDLEPLIHYTSISSPGIITELKEQLQIVFASQKNTWTFAALMQQLTDLGIRAEHNCGTWGAIDNIEKCAINQRYATELLDILSEYLPILLEKESFFSNRFK